MEGNGLSDRFYPFIWLKALAARHREYAGMSMGFGPALFGHSPDFVVRALEDQIKSGIEIGPQSALAGEVARLICHRTGMERAIFCTQAQKQCWPRCWNSYRVGARLPYSVALHGIFDEGLVRPVMYLRQSRRLDL